MRAMKDSGVEWIGEIPVKWEIHRIKNNFYIISGSGFKPDLQGETNGDYPVCKASDISLAGQKLYHSANFISEQIAQQEHFAIIPKDSILFPKIGEAMKKNSRTICKIDCCLDNNCQALVPNKINSIYSYYLLSCIDMEIFDNKGAIPSINNQKLLSSFIPYPDIVEQTAIASYLDKKCSNIDAIITKNEQIIEKLKEYKSSLITETVTKGLNPDVEMKDSGVEWIGKIPVEWKIHRIKNNFYIISGSGFKPDLQGETNGDYPVCKASDISLAGQKLYHSANFISERIAQQEHFAIIPKDSILFPKIGEAMKKNSRTICKIDCCLDNNCQALVPNKINSIYSYYLLSCIDMEIFDNKGAIPSINNQKLLSSFIPYPDIVEQTAIANYLDEKCSKIDANIKNRELIIQKLAEYKKSLIYEVVTGKKEII